MQLPFEYIGQLCSTEGAQKKNAWNNMNIVLEIFFIIVVGCWKNLIQHVQCTSSPENSFEIVIFGLCNHIYNMETSLYSHLETKKGKKLACSCIYNSSSGEILLYHVLDEWILIKSNPLFTNDPWNWANQQMDEFKKIAFFLFQWHYFGIFLTYTKR